jgi:hypothetical protein
MVHSVLISVRRIEGWTNGTLDHEADLSALNQTVAIGREVQMN